MSNFVSDDNMTALMTAIGNKKDNKPIEVTWDQYIAMSDAQKEGKHFIISEAPSSGIKAESIIYDNTESELEATNVQGVIDELADSKGAGGGIFYGTCTGEEANQIKAVTVSNEQSFKLKAGSVLSVKFDANNTYSATAENPVKLNVNNTGAKQIYGGNTATPTGTNTTYFGRLNYYNYYVYDGTYWVWAGSSADNNTTYTPQALGFGYATCSTAAATAAKVATLSGYSLVTNGIVSVKFTNSVPANATLNINNKGAKNIYYQGAKIVAGVIKAGDIATFVYSGNYNLICIDRGSAENVTYDNSQSGLSATKVQGAIDEVATPTFTEASTRANIASGETIPTLFGKIKKWFTDLPSMFVSKSGDTMSGNLQVDRQDGTVSEYGKSYLIAGNTIAEGTAKNSRGILRLYDRSTRFANVIADELTANRTITLPNENGTVALTNDIPTDFVSKSNGGTFSSAVTVNGDIVGRAHIKVDRQNGTTSSVGDSYVMIGNSISSGTAKNSKGILRLYSNGTNYVQLLSTPSLTGNRNADLPDKNGNVQVNNSITDLEDILLPHSNVTPTSSGKTTLLKYIQDVVIPKSSFIYGFAASTFTDLPSTDWGYDIIVIKLGGVFVLCSRQQSEGIMYVRNTNASNQWIGSWKQL